MDGKTWVKVVKVVATGIKQMAVRNVAFLYIYSLLIYLYRSVPTNYMQMICDFPNWWDFLTYYRFKSHANVSKYLETFAEENIRVGKEEAGKRSPNQAYDTFQEKQDKAQTRQLLELTHQNIRGWINQWHLIMIISTAIQNIPSKLWIYSFISGNLHPHHCMTFYYWIKKILPAVKTVETEYF